VQKSAAASAERLLAATEAAEEVGRIAVAVGELDSFAAETIAQESLLAGSAGKLAAAGLDSGLGSQ
jgi:hypothetical protein